MKNNRLTPRKIQAVETKSKLYRTAKELFVKYGFENVSVDSIVEAAGVSKGAFYVHFDSKDTLITALIGDYVKELDLDYKSHIESLDTRASASDILISLIGKIADILIHTIGHEQMKTVYKVQLTKTVNTDAVMSYSRDLYKLFSDILSRGIQQGEFTAVMPVDMLAKHCLIALRGLTYEWCVRYLDFDLKEQSLKHFELLLTGIGKHTRT